LKFRRQMPLGPFIADFYCSSARLVVEVDGVSHIESRTDERRDAWMVNQGIRVLRFSNHDVLSNVEGVLIAIRQCTRGAPPPNPLPQGEGE
jgi:very-short-patch-repair endonuclease